MLSFGSNICLFTVLSHFQLQLSYIYCPFHTYSFYSHAFLANTSEKRASFEDDDEVEEPVNDSTAVQSDSTDAWAEEESLMSGIFSLETAAEKKVAESLYNNGNVMQEVRCKYFDSN